MRVKKIVKYKQMKIKYLLTLAAFFLVYPFAFSQQKIAVDFILSGDIKDSNLDSVSIQYINAQGKIIQETAATKQGIFKFTGNINQPTFSYLVFKHKGEKISRAAAESKRKVAYLESGEMKITTQANSQGYLEVQGSKTQLEWKAFLNETYVLDKLIDSLNKLNATNHNQPLAKEDGSRKQLTEAKKNLAKVSYRYFISHPTSFVTSDRVKYLTSSYSLDSLKTLYGKFSPSIKESMDGKRLAGEIKSREVGLVGTKAFAFDVKDKDSSHVSLEGMKGKYVLLDFWATWCVPCRASMPHLISLYTQYKDKNFALVGIADDDRNVKNWLAAIENDKIGLWPQVLRGLDAQLFIKGIDNPRDISQQYGVKALPTKILIDPKGEIIGRFDGQHSSDEELEKMLSTLLKP
jgi:thiol-disulfide isomerase/thioredoxin